MKSNPIDLETLCDELLDEHRQLQQSHESVLPAARGCVKDEARDAREVHGVKLRIHTEKLQAFRKALRKQSAVREKTKI